MKTGQFKFYLILIVFLAINQAATYYIIKSAESSSAHGPVQIPLSSPHKSQAAIKVWTNIAAVDLFSYNFKNIESNINAHSKYFSTSEWAQYLQGIAKTQLIKRVHEQHLVVSAVATAPVQIIKHGVKDGSYEWNVSLPLLVTYTGPATSIDQKLTLEMSITHVSAAEGVDGLNITQFTIKPTMEKNDKAAKP